MSMELQFQLNPPDSCTSDHDVGLNETFTKSDIIRNTNKCKA